MRSSSASSLCSMSTAPGLESRWASAHFRARPKWPTFCACTQTNRCAWIAIIIIILLFMDYTKLHNRSLYIHTFVSAIGSVNRDSS